MSCNIFCYTVIYLTKCQAKPPTSITAFIGREDLSDENKIILQNYVDTINSEYIHLVLVDKLLTSALESFVAPKKRAAEDIIDNRAVKKVENNIH